MKNFKRGITNKNFITILQEKYQQGGWWKDVVDDKELFVAIRDDYINVYYQGNSLIKLSFNDNNLVVETHYKYLCQPSKKPCLIKAGASGSFFSGDSTCEGIKGSLDDYLIHNLAEIDSIKTASTAYSGVEKKGIQKILNCNSNIVDLEIALTKEAQDDENNVEESKNPKAKRIDFAAFQKNNACYDLIFFEAKHFSNTKELRTDRKPQPKVLKQISTYNDLLRRYESDIKESYNLVCRNLCELLPSDQLDQSVVDIATGSHSIRVDIEPRLVLFGFDEDQSIGKHWGPHKEKLEGSLKKRFLARGNPSGFKNGISQPKK